MAIEATIEDRFSINLSRLRLAPLCRTRGMVGRYGPASSSRDAKTESPATTRPAVLKVFLREAAVDSSSHLRWPVFASRAKRLPPTCGRKRHKSLADIPLPFISRGLVDACHFFRRSSNRKRKQFRRQCNKQGCSRSRCVRRRPGNRRGFFSRAFVRCRLRGRTATNRGSVREPRSWQITSSAATAGDGSAPKR